MPLLDIFQTIVAAVGGCLAFILGLCKLAEVFEKIFKKEKINRISEGISRISFKAGAIKIFSLWAYINNATFGQKIFSWRALGVSILLTNCWAMIFIAIFSVHSSMFRQWMLYIVELNSLWPTSLAIYVCILFVEFLSICLTRKIYRVTLSKGSTQLKTAVAIDLFGSVCIYYMGLAIIKLILLRQMPLSPLDSLLTWLDANNLTTLLKVTKDFDMSNFKPDGSGKFTTNIPLSTEVVYAFPEGVFFFTSILTSIWLWGYVAAYGIAYWLIRMDRVSSNLGRWLNMDEHPLLALSTVVGVILAVLYLLASVAKIAYKLIM